MLTRRDICRRGGGSFVRRSRELLPQAMDGMCVLRELRRHGRPVVAISGMGELGPEAVVAGAHAFLEKHGRDVDDLLDMIRDAYRHDPWPAGG